MTQPISPNQNLAIQFGEKVHLESSEKCLLSAKLIFFKKTTQLFFLYI